MKFATKHESKRCARIGFLSDIVGKVKTIETPFLILHTQGGQIPHLTHDAFQLNNTDTHILQIPVENMHQYKETMDKYQGNITEFIGCPDSLSCVVFQDPSRDPNISIKEGHSAKDKVPLWTKNGKFYYDAKLYMDIVESFKPTMYCFLSDNDTDPESQNKRISKSVDNTLKFYKECLERHKNSSVLKNSFVIASIVGGYCTKSRQKCLDVMLKDEEIGGILIDGLQGNNTDVASISFNQVEPVMDYLAERIPSNKLLSINGCWNPENILKFVQYGVDVFDTSYCYLVTQRSGALTFALNENESTEDFEINLKDGKYAESFEPILKSCDCLCCEKYTMAYIHHLLMVHELLGPVLLMMHNIHHYQRFFKTIRECIKTDKLSVLEELIAKQYKSFEIKMELRKKEKIDLN